MDHFNTASLKEITQLGMWDGILLPPADRTFLGRTPEEELLMALSFREGNRDSKSIQEWINILLKKFDLEAVRSLPLESLDEATSRRVALAAAAAPSPVRLVLFDSFSDLDLASRKSLNDHIKRIEAEGCRIIFLKEEEGVSKTRTDQPLPKSRVFPFLSIGRGGIEKEESPRFLKKVPSSIGLLLLLIYAGSMAFMTHLPSILLMGVLPLLLLLSKPRLFLQLLKSFLPLLPVMAALLLVTLLWNSHGSWREGFFLWISTALKLLFIATFSLIYATSVSSLRLLGGFSRLLSPFARLGLNIRPFSVIPAIALQKIPYVIQLLELLCGEEWRSKRFRLFLKLGGLLRVFYQGLLEEGRRVGLTLAVYGYGLSRRPLILSSMEESRLAGIFFTLFVTAFILMGLWQEGVMTP